MIQAAKAIGTDLATTGSNNVYITDVLNFVSYYYPQFPLANIYSVIIGYNGNYKGVLFIEFNEFPNLLQ